MRKTIFATIIAAGLAAAAPAHADDIAYCEALGKAAVWVAEGRDKGRDKVSFEMAALGRPDAPFEVRVDMMDVIELIYNDKTMKKMTPARIGPSIFVACLRARKERRK